MDQKTEQKNQTLTSIPLPSLLRPVTPKTPLFQPSPISYKLQTTAIKPPSPFSLTTKTSLAKTISKRQPPLTHFSGELRHQNELVTTLFLANNDLNTKPSS
uniref:Uncharacterized protein n=1 Tax=Solanum tuberosum TaxID=4113 RepID=M1DX83_SOLTU